MPTCGKFSKLTCNDAIGIVIERNADYRPLGALVAPVALVFDEMAFKRDKDCENPMEF